MNKSFLSLMPLNPTVGLCRACSREPDMNRLQSIAWKRGKGRGGKTAIWRSHSRGNEIHRRHGAGANQLAKA